MNVWSFDDDAGNNASTAVRSEIQPSKRAAGGSFQVKKHAFFADAECDASTYSCEPPSSRRKANGRKELVLESDDGDDALGEDQEQRQSKGKATDVGDKRSQSSTSSAKADELGVPDIVHTVLRSKVSPPDPSTTAAAASTSKKKRVSLSDLSQENELFMYYLVREFLKQHGADDVAVNLFDKERPMQVLHEKEAKKIFERITGYKESSSRSSGSSGKQDDKQCARTLLEQFVVVWDEKTHKRKYDRPSSSSSSSSRRSSGSRRSEAPSESSSTTPSSLKKSSSSSTKKKKPTLNVITSAEELDKADELSGAQVEIDYNRLNHPGSTPKPQSTDAAAVACILGDPGSTPKARASDLKTLGFDDDELHTPVPAENVRTSSSTIAAVVVPSEEDDVDASDISEYARKKRIAKKHSKHVHLGEAGTTPRKEYIFFRETPPSFVTETVEAAVEVYEKLVQDPVFHQQAAPQERFVELQSSEVSKYKIGQEVRGLGAQRHVSGVVSKIFGSRQCGSSGPGTIVIDTCPDACTISSLQPRSSAGASVAPMGAGLDKDDEDFMDELA